MRQRKLSLVLVYPSSKRPATQLTYRRQSSPMGSKDDAPTWADQWGSGDNGSIKRGGGGSNAKEEKKTVAGNVKVAASEGFVKVKAAALVGAQKVKSGTSSGIKWVKEQYQKRASK